MNILITGTSSGIGYVVAKRFLKYGHTVYGIDLKDSDIINDNYFHYIADIKDKNSLPNLNDIEIIFNNAGVQNSQNDIENNLMGTINVTEKYAFNKKIKSVLFNASASAHSGFEFPEYVAAKAGVIGYMKNISVRLVKYGALANSISLGGVLTDSNNQVISNKKLWCKIMKSTPLKKWMTEEEVADWVYFLTITNKSMSGQDILIDNGEFNLNNTFIWPDYNF